MTIQELLTWMGTVGASDMHLKTGRPPLVRVDGELKAFDLPVLSGAAIEELLVPVMPDQAAKQVEKDGAIQFSFAVPGEARCRASLYRQRGESGAALRRIPLDAPTVESLGFPAIVGKLAEHKSGLVVLTGPAGHGVSTTLAAALEHINRARPVHIATIENPIEFVFQDKMATVTQREIPLDAPSLETARAAALQHDADVISLGDLLLGDGLECALAAAEAGRLVFATMRCSGAVKALERIMVSVAAERSASLRQRLAVQLRGITSQRLAVKIGGGRAAGLEVMVVNDAVGQLLAENRIKEVDKAISEGNYYGMKTLNQSLAGLCAQGVISKESALAATDKPGELELLFMGVKTH